MTISSRIAEIEIRNTETHEGSSVVVDDDIAYLLSLVAKYRSALEVSCETMKRLQDYAIEIEKNHPEKCTHGNGYSLLGQLAQQVSTDCGSAQAEIAKLLEGV